MPVGAAIVGSAAIGGVASTVASSKAAKAQQKATDATLQANRESLAQQQANTAVARGVGDAALGQLAARNGFAPSVSSYGVGAPSGQSVVANMGFGGGRELTQPPGGITYGPASTPQAGAPNYDALLASRPDVAAAVNDPNGGFEGATPQERAANWYSRYGQASGVQLPTYTAQEAQAAQPQTDVRLSPQAQVQNYSRPADQQAPNPYAPQQYTAPQYNRPDYAPQLDQSLTAFKGSGEYAAADNAFQQLANGSNAQFAATGALQSGAAQKALADRAAANSVQYFGQFANRVGNQYNTDRARVDANYNFDTGLNSQNAFNYAGLNNSNQQFAANYNQNAYQYGQNRADNTFNTDRAYGTDLALGNRSYETNRYDTGTQNLFNLANLGQGAAAQSNAATQNANSANSNALFSNAAAQGNAALTNAANFNNLLQSGVNAYAYYNRPPTGAAAIPKANPYAVGGGY